MTKRQASYAIATVIIFLFLCATTLTYQGGNHLQIEISSTVEKAIFVVRNIAVRSNFIDLSKRTLVEGQILFYAGSHDPINVLKSNYLLIRSHRDCFVIDLHDSQAGRTKFFDNWSIWLLSELDNNQITYTVITDKNNFYDIVPLHEPKQ